MDRKRFCDEHHVYRHWSNESLFATSNKSKIGTSLHIVGDIDRPCNCDHFRSFHHTMYK